MGSAASARRLARAATGKCFLPALRERTRVDAPLLDNCPNLELILQTGGHAYHLDKETASQRGIAVALGRRVAMPNCGRRRTRFWLAPGAGTPDLPIASGNEPWWLATTNWWLASWSHDGAFGYGWHGRPIARLAEAFGMQVLAWERTGDGLVVDEFGVRRLPLDELLGQADVLSVDLRLSEESRGFFDRAKFGLMKDGVYLINTARGAIINEEALVEALQNGKLAGAGLAVFATQLCLGCVGYCGGHGV